jgi:hypothetical protein
LEALIRIVMKAIILPIGNPPSAGMMLMVSLPVGTNKASAQMLFLVWVTLTEHKWVILGECRGVMLICHFGLSSIDEEYANKNAGYWPKPKLLDWTAPSKSDDPSTKR